MPAISRPGGRLLPLAAVALHERAEVALARILEREAVERRPVGAHHHERVVDRDRPRVPLEQLAEVRLADPGLDAAADLDADGGRDGRRSTDAPRGVDLAVAALADQAIDPIVQTRFDAGDLLAALEQRLALGRASIACASASSRWWGGESRPHRTAGRRRTEAPAVYTVQQLLHLDAA